MEKDNNMLLNILVFLMTISYCTGMYFVYYIVILYSYLINACYLYVFMYAGWMVNVTFSGNTTGAATPI